MAIYTTNSNVEWIVNRMLDDEGTNRHGFNSVCICLCVSIIYAKYSFAAYDDVFPFIELQEFLPIL